jgi:muramoyltetrapeptide carboxypeptidase
MNTTSTHRTIGIAGPSYTMPEPDIQAGLDILHKAGFQTRLAANVSATYGHFAGEDQNRAQGLMSLCGMPEVDAILMTRGGNGSLRMLPFFDWSSVNPAQPWIGFSDSTALLCARYLKTGQFSWHAPMLRQVKNGLDAPDMQFLRSILNGTPHQGYDAQDLEQVSLLHAGTTTGTLWGGNLAILRSLCGTPWMPKPKQGDILFVEDLGDDNWHIDRDLEQLYQAGVFENLGGLIFGNFSDISDSTSVPFGFTMREVFERHAARINGPVIMDFPAGHEGLNLPLPIGKTVTLTAGANGTTLSWEN